LWTFGQQFYVIKRNPTPGSPAYEELAKKRELKNKTNGVLPIDNETGTTQIDPGTEQPKQRQQPSKKKKKRK
jgi:YidC/Oxa1 family membrane protein insertase